jgi:hypothetical protein
MMNIIKKLSLLLPAFFMPSLVAAVDIPILPDIIEDTLAGVFSLNPAGELWLARFLLWVMFFAVLWIPASKLFKEHRKPIGTFVFIASLIGALTIPKTLVTAIYSTYGFVVGLIAIGVPIILLFWLSRKLGDPNTRGGRVIRAVIYIVIAYILDALIFNSGEVLNFMGEGTGGYPTIVSIFQFAAAVFLIMGIWNLIKAIIGPGGESGEGRGIGESIKNFTGKLKKGKEDLGEARKNMEDVFGREKVEQNLLNDLERLESQQADSNKSIIKYLQELLNLLDTYFKGKTAKMQFNFTEHMGRVTNLFNKIKEIQVNYEDTLKKSKEEIAKLNKIDSLIFKEMKEARKQIFDSMKQVDAKAVAEGRLIGDDKVSAMNQDQKLHYVEYKKTILLISKVRQQVNNIRNSLKGIDKILDKEKEFDKKMDQIHKKLSLYKGPSGIQYNISKIKGLIKDAIGLKEDVERLIGEQKHQIDKVGELILEIERFDKRVIKNMNVSEKVEEKAAGG